MQREYLQKPPVVGNEDCHPKKDKTDIEYQLNELKDHSEQMKKLILTLYDRLKPVMSPDCDITSSCCVKECSDNKLEMISPLATDIRLINISLSNSILKINEIFNKIQI